MNQAAAQSRSGAETPDALREYAESLSRDSDGRPMRDAMKSFLTTLLAPMERYRARRLARSLSPLRLHQGCAGNHLEGWVNLDLYRPGRRLELRWDLRRGIPFEASTVDAIFSEHLLEHLSVASTLRLLHESYRVLRPSGTLRIGVPDLERYVNAYLGDDPLIGLVRSGRPTVGLAFTEPFFLHGHRSMYDFETLALLLRDAGFGLVERSRHGQSRISPVPDSQSREAETLYVEAVK